MSCHKPAKTYQEQLEILKSRGLEIPDEVRALHYLAHHNYYRLTAYRIPFTQPGNPDQFLPGTTFDDLWNLYHFDRTLRQIVNEAVKRVEISARARWAYVLGHGYGAQAYENPCWNIAFISAIYAPTTPDFGTAVSPLPFNCRKALRPRSSPT